MKFCHECGKPRPVTQCLTPREQSIVPLIAMGKSNKTIAYDLQIAEGTLKIYISRLYAKLGLSGPNRVTVCLMFQQGKFEPHVCQAKEN